MRPHMYIQYPTITARQAPIHALWLLWVKLPCMYLDLNCRRTVWSPSSTQCMPRWNLWRWKVQALSPPKRLWTWQRAPNLERLSHPRQSPGSAVCGGPVQRNLWILVKPSILTRLVSAGIIIQSQATPTLFSGHSHFQFVDTCCIMRMSLYMYFIWWFLKLRRACTLYPVCFCPHSPASSQIFHGCRIKSGNEANLFSSP